ncbi:MAG: hypothetical protein WCK49_10800 [Myxococcaceae bacterium]
MIKLILTTLSFCFFVGAKEKIFQIEHNIFTVARNLVDYKSVFEKPFLDHLDRADFQEHWLDLGAGLGYALGQYAVKTENDVQNTCRNHMRLTAVSASKVNWLSSWSMYDLEGLIDLDYWVRIRKIEKALSRVHFMEGHLIEDYCNDENEIKEGIDCHTFNYRNLAGPRGVHLLTDYYGALTYSNRIDQVLASIGRILAGRDSEIFAVGNIPCITKTDSRECSTERDFWNFFDYLEIAGFSAESGEEVFSSSNLGLRLARSIRNIYMPIIFLVDQFFMKGTRPFYLQSGPFKYHLRINEEALARGYLLIPKLELLYDEAYLTPTQLRVFKIIPGEHIQVPLFGVLALANQAYF